MKFEELNLNEDLMRGIIETGFTECMEVQEKTIPEVLAGKDVLVQSQTGSGKTAAFLISIFEMFRKGDNENPTALIILPTRELAVQIEEEAGRIGRYMEFTMGSFYGGVGYAKQEKMLKDKVNIIIGTPGRLIDLSQQRKLSFSSIDIVVIDEADRLFDMGFYPDISNIMGQMKPAAQRRTLLFSATMSIKAKNLAWRFMVEPVEIEINPEQITVDNIEQHIFHVNTGEKMRLLLGLLKEYGPGNALIFTNTKQAAFEVSKRLEKNGYNCKYIIGDLPQKKRLSIIDNMKSGKVPFLVATDVAARGLHIDDLELVVNYDIPEDCENYVHRIGRTARAGKTGKAVSFACEKFVYGLEAIESFIEMKIPVEWHDESLLLEDKSRGQYFRLDRTGGGGTEGDRRRKGSSTARGSTRTGRSSERGKQRKVAVEKSGGRESRQAHRKKQKSQEAVHGGSGRGQGQEQKHRSPKSHGQGQPRGGKKGAPVRKKQSEMTYQERIAYYEEKYGDVFSGTIEKKAKEKKGVLKKLKNVFSRKKK